MPRNSAYSEKEKRNITLEEARILFFEQPEEERHRFVFRCGDPACRAEKWPLIVAALYDREEPEDESLRSPYYREHASHPHIDSCTWIKDKDDKPVEGVTEERQASPSAPVDVELGLIFKIEDAEGGADSRVPTGDSAPAISLSTPAVREPAHTEGNEDSENRLSRAQTTKFMSSVAARYLSLTVHQRKSIELTIEDITKGAFYNVCLPIFTYHPGLQRERIFHGHVKISELTSVFYIGFNPRMSPTGDRTDRNHHAQIKLTKKWLRENDRALHETLHTLYASGEDAYCFFYTDKPIEIKNGNVEFPVDNPNMIAVIDRAEMDVLKPEWE